MNIFLVALIAYLCGPSARGQVDQSKFRGTLHTRRYFYAGGSYVKQGSSEITHGQMYVEHLVPAKVTKDLPILFIHGNGMTGTNFLNTPDGRTGWADYFMSQGYEVYLVDQTARARSVWQNGIDGNLSTTLNTYFVESRVTATQRYNLWPQAILHTQWPGNGSVGDETFDAFYSTLMPSLASAVEAAELMKAAGSKLIDEIGPLIILTHSQSGYIGWILGDSRPKNVKAIIAIEPSGPPFQEAIFSTARARAYGLTDIPISFTPPISSAADLRPVVVSGISALNYTCFQQSPPARQLTNLVDIPVLVVTSESGLHAVYDDCSVQFLVEGGVNATHIRLQDVGIHGNGHMMFMETNSLEIADSVVQQWLSETL
ncbi:Alpha/Beta hydrolase protein [Hygrophoropsis aurantiaca]|uniref:Alpha/Beta hydrolase protein n=1 Tax=Hygrophoropsis aurantiaca TaxID=72124 RepID=A0ACB8A3H4_9AGAM|nr:Alpha/Beta hydrolase protein [Hygrophoropsis aurantiaca]